jgi:3-oxoacyl-[acyl-carrier protein] reductase
MPDPRIALITGASRGIGRYLTDHLLEHGFVVVGCSRKPPEAPPTSDRYHHHLVDVTDEPAVQKLFSAIRRTHSRLDVLVNNAGIAAMNHALLTPITQARRVVDVNLIGTFLFAREAAKLMKKHGGGRIVNFATVATPLKLQGEAIYAASKAGVVTLTHVLSREFAAFGITVNAVGPTPIDTDLIRAIPPDKIDALLDRQAIRRMGTMADVSNVVDFYLRPESDFITGQVLYLGGV